MKYKYNLDSTSKKFTCPSCSKKRLVRYIETESHNYLGEQYGRCDRESNCGYHLAPSQNKTIVNIITTKKIRPISIIDEKYLNAVATKYNKNNLFIYLKKHFTEEEILEVFEKYKVGTSKLWNGSTVFWQIDQFNRIRTGKIMLLNADSGKRIKEPFPHINWVHKTLNLKDYNLAQCLFGENLIKNQLQQNATNKTIALVESEKTALTMSLFLKSTLWIATGSKQNLKLDLLKPLKGCNVILFPDCGEFEDWNKKAIELNKHGFKFKCSSLLENNNYIKGTDLADIYFDLSENNKKEIIEECSMSDTEVKLQRMTKKNPALLNLIDTFELMDEKGIGIRTNLLK
jgi:hypothetical protein